jgi:hypothetical protein
MPLTTISASTGTTILIFAEESNGILVSRMTLCNTTGGPLTLNLNNTYGDPIQSSSILNGVTLNSSQTFVWENFYIPFCWTLNVTTTGTLDVTIFYSIPKEPL